MQGRANKKGEKWFQWNMAYCIRWVFYNSSFNCHFFSTWRIHSCRCLPRI